jgi:hypothetical protein
MLGPSMIFLGTPAALLLSFTAVRISAGGFAVTAMTLSSLEAAALLVMILMSL